METELLFFFSDLREDITYNFFIKEVILLPALSFLNLMIESNDNKSLSSILFNNDAPLVRQSTRIYHKPNKYSVIAYHMTLLAVV